MKKQDFIDYQKKNNLTLNELAQKIGIAYSTLWLFLNTSSKRKRGVMYKLKDFFNAHIASGKQLELLEPVESKEVKEEIKEEPKVEVAAQEEVEQPEEHEEGLCLCECVRQYREFMLSLSASLLTLNSQEIISDETYCGLDKYIESMYDIHARLLEFIDQGGCLKDNDDQEEHLG
jgi:transcriptional regulator with XRE-family HTH domain